MWLLKCNAFDGIIRENLNFYYIYMFQRETPFSKTFVLKEFFNVGIMLLLNYWAKARKIYQNVDNS